MKLYETFGDILSMSPLIQQQMKNENYHNNWHLKFILTHYINEFGQNPLLFMTMTNIESSVNRNTLSHHIQIRDGTMEVTRRIICMCVLFVGTQF